MLFDAKKAWLLDQANEKVGARGLEPPAESSQPLSDVSPPNRKIRKLRISCHSTGSEVF
jgi:hypothetical protein